MQDPPTPSEILQAVADFLRESVMPALPAHTAFHVRVSANALDLVRRQIEQAPGADAAESASAEALLGRKGSLQEMNTELCRRIAGGTMDLATPGLAEHLWATTMAKLSVDQPRYASYLAELKNQPDSEPK